MAQVSTQQRVKAFGRRVLMVTQNAGDVGRESYRWLRRDREVTNFTYELTDLNMRHFAWFVANATRRGVAEIEGYFHELATDTELREFLIAQGDADPQAYLTDEPRFGRRFAWYALVRALKPAHVVETGTEKGLGSMVFAAALLRNGTGRVTTIDIAPTTGYLIGGKWAEVIDYRSGDSHQIIPSLAPVDFFIHDSLHTPEHERGELELVTPILTDNAAVLTDAGHHSVELLDWVAAHPERVFMYLQEQPRDHWYGGGGIGISPSPV